MAKTISLYASSKKKGGENRCVVEQGAIMVADTEGITTAVTVAAAVAAAVAGILILNAAS